MNSSASLLSRIEVGRDDIGNIVVVASGYEQTKATVVLSINAAMKVVEAIERCVSSEEVAFKWQRGAAPEIGTEVKG